MPKPYLVVVACAFILLAASPGLAETAPDRGAVVEKVVCTADQNQSYALYLPSSYASDKAWPIIYCFDPGARGSVPVSRFRQAAETYGYIVVGSNNSRNGIAVGDAVNAMWADTHARFSIDDHRIYTAGFSGGARVAISVAIGSRGLVAGVVACGAGFPPSAAPSRDQKFVLFGAVGTDDFNLPEMRHLADALDATGATYRIDVWDGPHDWAPVEVCTTAVEWLELHAIRTGLRARDDVLVEKWLHRDEKRAAAFRSAGEWIDAAAAYRAIVSDYRGLRDTVDEEGRLEAILSEKAYAEAVKNERDDEFRQRKFTSEMVRNVSLLGDAEHRAVALADLKREVASLRKKADDTSDARARRVAQRALGEAWVAALTISGELYEKKEYRLAATTLSAADTIRPNDPGILYGLGRLYALAGDKKRAIEALRAAIAAGFSNEKLLSTDPELEALRESDEFRKLVEALRTRSGA